MDESKNLINSNISLEEFISEGTYGKVFKARQNITGEKVAVKEIKIDLEAEGISSTSLREIAILSELKHPNIINLKEVICSEMKLYLIFDYLDTDLKKYIDEELPKEVFLDENDVRTILFQILEGIKYCHSRKILHRDLKPQNILVKKNDGIIKIADFGLARVYSIPIRPYTKEVLTLAYRSPEILLGMEEYSEFVDLWSVGCIFAEISSKQILFHGENETDQIHKIFSILGNPDPKIYADLGMKGTDNMLASFKRYVPKNLQTLLPRIDPVGIDLLTKLLDYNPIRRITAIDALNHPYFNPIREQISKKDER